MLGIGEGSSLRGEVGDSMLGAGWNDDTDGLLLNGGVGVVSWRVMDAMATVGDCSGDA